MTSADDNDHQVIILSFFDEVTGVAVQKVTGILARRKAIENALLAVTHVVLVSHRDNSGSFLLFQVRNEISQGSGGYFFIAVLDGHGSGHAEEDGVRGGVVHALRHVVQLALVQPESLGDFQVVVAFLVFEVIFGDGSAAVDDVKPGREERVLEDEASVPHLLRFTAKIGEGLLANQVGVVATAIVLAAAGRTFALRPVVATTVVVAFARFVERRSAARITSLATIRFWRWR